MKIKIPYQTISKDRMFDTDKSLFDNFDLKVTTLNELADTAWRVLFKPRRKYMYLALERLFGFTAFILFVLSLVALYFILIPQDYFCMCAAWVMFASFLIASIAPFVVIKLVFKQKIRYDKRKVESLRALLDIGNKIYDDTRTLVIKRIRRNIDREKKFSQILSKGLSIIFTVFGTVLISYGSAFYSSCCCSCCSCSSSCPEPSITLIFIGSLVMLLSVFTLVRGDLLKCASRFYSEELLLAYEEIQYEETI